VELPTRHHPEALTREPLYGSRVGLVQDRAVAELPVLPLPEGPANRNPRFQVEGLGGLVVVARELPEAPVGRHPGRAPRRRLDGGARLAQPLQLLRLPWPELRGFEA
jgi:hypothetical protein